MEVHSDNLVVPLSLGVVK